ncbi:hypothetical protein K488DRAFT_75267, partial [Vararia minispora EC-137]
MARVLQPYLNDNINIFNITNSLKEWALPGFFITDFHSLQHLPENRSLSPSLIQDIYHQIVDIGNDQRASFPIILAIPDQLWQEQAAIAKYNLVDWTQGKLFLVPPTGCYILHGQHRARVGISGWPVKLLPYAATISLGSTRAFLSLIIMEDNLARSQVTLPKQRLKWYLQGSLSAAYTGTKGSPSSATASHLFQLRKSFIQSEEKTTSGSAYLGLTTVKRFASGFFHLTANDIFMDYASDTKLNNLFNESPFLGGFLHDQSWQDIFQSKDEKRFPPWIKISNWIEWANKNGLKGASNSFSVTQVAKTLNKFSIVVTEQTFPLQVFSDSQFQSLGSSVVVDNPFDGRIGLDYMFSHVKKGDLTPFFNQFSEEACNMNAVIYFCWKVISKPSHTYAGRSWPSTALGVTAVMAMMSLATPSQPFEMPSVKVFDDNLLDDPKVWAKTSELLWLFYHIGSHVIKMLSNLKVSVLNDLQFRFLFKQEDKLFLPFLTDFGPSVQIREKEVKHQPLITFFNIMDKNIYLHARKKLEAASQHYQMLSFLFMSVFGTAAGQDLPFIPWTEQESINIDKKLLVPLRLPQLVRELTLDEVQMTAVDYVVSLNLKDIAIPASSLSEADQEKAQSSSQHPSYLYTFDYKPLIIDDL